MPTERSATERHRSGLARWLGHQFVLRAADRCLGRVRLCSHRRGPRGLQCGARIEPYPGSQNRLASFVLTIVFPRGVTRGCDSHSAWWPSGIGSIYVRPLGRARHRTRSSPDRRSGCLRCIGADARDPFEVVPLAQSAQLRALRTAVRNAGRPLYVAWRRPVGDIDPAQRTPDRRRCLPAERPFSRRAREKSDSVGRRGHPRRARILP
jgi:hypothetical protein